MIAVRKLCQQHWPTRTKNSIRGLCFNTEAGVPNALMCCDWLSVAVQKCMHKIISMPVSWLQVRYFPVSLGSSPSKATKQTCDDLSALDTFLFKANEKAFPTPLLHTCQYPSSVKLCRYVQDVTSISSSC